MSDANRRILTRRKLFYFPEVINPENHQLQGHLVDVTIEGLMLLGVDGFEKAKAYPMAIEFPGDDEQQNVTIDFTATCQWCQEGIDSETYAAGFKIIEIEKEKQDTLANLIEEFGMPERP